MSPLEYSPTFLLFHIIYQPNVLVKGRTGKEIYHSQWLLYILTGCVVK